MNDAIRKSYNNVRKQILTAAHHFQLLGVHRECLNPVVNVARRELAKHVHPDVNAAPDAHDLMARVNAAHQVLTENRARYLLELGGTPCTQCGGRGYTFKQKGFTKRVETICTICHGAGVTTKEKTK